MTAALDMSNDMSNDMADDMSNARLGLGLLTGRLGKIKSLMGGVAAWCSAA
ncbi:MAG: hypothetical protein Tsb0020_06310 [Haliangiales bacterium]